MREPMIAPSLREMRSMAVRGRRRCRECQTPALGFQRPQWAVGVEPGPRKSAAAAGEDAVTDVDEVEPACKADRRRPTAPVEVAGAIEVEGDDRSVDALEVAAVVVPVGVGVTDPMLPLTITLPIPIVEEIDSTFPPDTAMPVVCPWNG